MSLTNEEIDAVEAALKDALLHYCREAVSMRWARDNGPRLIAALREAREGETRMRELLGRWRVGDGDVAIYQEPRGAAVFVRHEHGSGFPISAEVAFMFAQDAHTALQPAGVPHA